MAEIHSLLMAMDRLWFHHVILLSEPISIIWSKGIDVSPICSQSSMLSSDNPQLNEHKTSITSPANSVSQDSCDKEVAEEEERKAAIDETEQPTSENKNQIVKKGKSRPPCLTFHRHCRSLNYYDDIHRCLKLPRSLSCKTSYDLEQQEVQGFKDLGFQFEKDRLTPRTISVIPGLQRLGEGPESTFNDTNYVTSPMEGKEGEQEEEKRGVLVRPYLSEAWKVKKPNSPLLRLRIARVHNKEDMQKCLMVWAKTVATSIHQGR
uniref:Uncharacterized protein n=1 Tax=Opuntia streptacantha TaxID=393608 RepID=A0A7C9CME5_OPUST